VNKTKKWELTEAAQEDVIIEKNKQKNECYARKVNLNKPLL